MLRSLHSRPATTCLRHNLKLSPISPSAVKRDFHASLRREFGPIDVLELCHSHLPYWTAIPLLATFPHVLRYFLADKRIITRRLEADQRLGPLLRAWWVGLKRQDTSSSLGIGDSSPDPELASSSVNRFEDQYGLPPRKRLRPLLTTTVLHCSWTLTAFVQMAGSSLSNNMALELYGLPLEAGAAVPSIAAIEAAIDALYSPGIDLSIISLLGVISGLLYLRRSTFLTGLRERDITTLWLLGRLIEPFNMPAIFQIRRLDTGAVAAVPQWLARYQTYLDSTRHRIHTFLRENMPVTLARLLARNPENMGFLETDGTIQVYTTLILFPLTTLTVSEFLSNTCSPAQILFLSACGFSAWMRAVALKRYELSQRAHFREQSRSWQPVVPKGKT